jgi:hypothetical protein
MFYTTDKDTQLNLFSGTHTFLSGASLKVYEDGKSWHNLFRSEVTLRIDENIFRPLFCSDNGAPNASIRVLVGMMILKEAHGLSDDQLFEQCRFNLLYRSALCLPNIDDPLPAISTYYLFRKRIVDWEKEQNENMIEKVFAQVTRSQVIDFQINGKKIRMDSKLIGSNIAWYSRYELIHETLRKAYPFIKSDLKHLSLSEFEITLLENINRESGDKVSYRSNKAEIETKLVEIGNVIYKITNYMCDYPSESVQNLCRVFCEQYIVDEQNIILRSKGDITAGSVQSPHDTECHYRNKGDNQVKGYSINVTETCDTDHSLNLITNVQVDVASVADCNFLQPAIEATKAITSTNPETVNADGAYHSVENQDYCKENTVDLILGAIQGKPPRYDLSYDDNNELIVTDLNTNTIISSRKIKSRKDNTLKWVIKDEKGNNRYFTQKEIDTCSLRKQIVSRSQEELNVRNNVEATIFQLGYHYSNDKSRYRGLIKHKMWASARCMWVNFVRIVNFIVLTDFICVKNIWKTSILSQRWVSFIEMLFVMCVGRNFRAIFPKNED